MSLVSELGGLNLILVQETGIRAPDCGGYLLEPTPVGKPSVQKFIEGNI
jgi:hypothetical protein